RASTSSGSADSCAPTAPCSSSATTPSTSSTRCCCSRRSSASSNARRAASATRTTGSTSPCRGRDPPASRSSPPRLLNGRAADAALRRDGFVMLYTGAIGEGGMRSYRDEPYRLKWEGRTGFLSLALATDAEVVFVAALGSDEAYYQSLLPTPETLIGLINGGDSARYRGMRLRFGLLGIHLVPGLLPFPVRLTHVIGKPLDLRDRERAQRDPEALAELHGRVWGDCQRFLDRVVASRARYTDALDRSIRGAERSLERIGL